MECRVTFEPKASETCAGCGKKRPEPARARATSGADMPRDIWIVSLSRDPFCSAECCRTYHGLRIGTIHSIGLGSCPDCGKHHTKAAQRPHENRCKDCAARFRKRRKFTDKNRCAGCGGVYTNVTKGCSHCWDREKNRRRRATAEYREKERARDRVRKSALREDPEWCKRERERDRARKRAKKNAPDNRPVEAAPPLASGTDGGSSVRGVNSTERRAA